MTFWRLITDGWIVAVMNLITVGGMLVVLSINTKRHAIYPESMPKSASGLARDFVLPYVAATIFYGSAMMNFGRAFKALV